MKRISGVVLALALVCLWGCSGGSGPAGTAPNGAETATGSEASDDPVFTDDFEEGEASGWAGETEEGGDEAAPADEPAEGQAASEDAAEAPAHSSDQSDQG